MHYVGPIFLATIPLGWSYFGWHFYRDPDSPFHRNWFESVMLGCAAGCLWPISGLIWWGLSRSLRNEGPC